MIMGAGKTTVICPLVVLMLADGNLFHNENLQFFLECSTYFNFFEFRRKTPIIFVCLTCQISFFLHVGLSLITVVVPTSLLEMSRGILSSVFSHVIPKPIYTLKFDRNSTSDGIHRKLELTRSLKGVVVTTPEAIKSMMLKLVDVLLNVQKRDEMVQKKICKKKPNNFLFLNLNLSLLKSFECQNSF
jgi:hypothetical protein